MTQQAGWNSNNDRVVLFVPPPPSFCVCECVCVFLFLLGFCFYSFVSEYLRVRTSFFLFLFFWFVTGTVRVSVKDTHHEIIERSSFILLLLFGCGLESLLSWCLSVSSSHFPKPEETQKIRDKKGKAIKIQPKNVNQLVVWLVICFSFVFCFVFSSSVWSRRASLPKVASATIVSSKKTTYCQSPCIYATAMLPRDIVWLPFSFVPLVSLYFLFYLQGGIFFSC